MNPNAQDNGAAGDLSRHLQKGSTGRLSVSTRSVEVDVYVMNGSVVAAESTDDIKFLLRRLYVAKAMSRARVTELGGLADMGDAVFGTLLEEVDNDLMDSALYERFRDNLSRYLGVRDSATFHSMGAVFVENFQMGHDTDELLLECAKLWRQSRKVPLSLVLAAAHTEDATPIQRLITDRLDGRRTVRQVLHEIPVEPVYGRAVLAQMLSNGIAIKADSADSRALPPAKEPVASYEEASTAMGDRRARRDPEQIDTEVIEATVRVDGSSYTREYLSNDAGDPDQQETEVIDNHIAAVDTSAFPSDEVWDDYLGVGLQMLDEPDQYRRGLPAGTDPELLDEDSPTVMADYDYSAARRPREVAPPPATTDLGTNTPSAAADPSQWLGDEDLDDDILDAFADHDYVRGGTETDGTFTQDLLERVEVADIDPVTEEAPIPVDEAPASRFGAPVLTDHEAHTKLDAANDNLILLVEVFDTASGSGRGRAAIQLLLEGCPSKFSPLFHDAKVRTDGTLPVERVMRNLQVRPAAEHRQLLNQGLMDLIERGLSLVMDEVDDDDAIDAILENTVGYRQAIGL